SAFSRNVLRLLLYLAAGLVILSGVHLRYENLLAAAAAFILSVVIAVAIGIMTAAIQLGTHKGSAVMWLFGSVAWLMTGTMFPVTVLPKPLLWIANLAAFSVVLLPSGLLIFSYMLKRARLEGTLSFY